MWGVAAVASWQRVAETTAVVASVALSVLVAGPGGALENLLRPLIGSGGTPAQRLAELAFGIPQALLLVPGLALWAWSPRLRPAGSALTVVATLGITIDLAVEDGLTPLATTLLSALLLLALYQTLTVPSLGPVPRRGPALLLAVLAGVTPWALQSGLLLVAELRGVPASAGDYVVVLVYTSLTATLLLLPLLRLDAFALAGQAAAVGAIVYALASLRWSGPDTALHRIAAVLAVATAVAYIDTIRQLAATQRPQAVGEQAGSGAAERRG